jgi:hypothetical protein
MAFPKKIGDLCSPARFYFILSIIVLIITLIQNIGNNGKYTLGNFSVKVPSTILVFIAKITYILFWTWILNLICKDGHKGIAWLLVLLPFILLFVILGLVLLNK